MTQLNLFRDKIATVCRHFRLCPKCRLSSLRTDSFRPYRDRNCRCLGWVLKRFWLSLLDPQVGESRRLTIADFSSRWHQRSVLHEPSFDCLPCEFLLQLGDAWLAAASHRQTMKDPTCFGVEFEECYRWQFCAAEADDEFGAVAAELRVLMKAGGCDLSTLVTMPRMLNFSQH